MLQAVKRGYDNMPTVRAAAAVLVCALAALAGCATRLGAEPPAGVSLAGNWKLDPAASDDPQKLLAQMRAEAIKIINRRQNAPPPPAPRPGQRGGAGSQVQEQEEDAVLAQPGPGEHRPDPLLRSPMAHVILTSLARGDFLSVRQSAGEMVLDYGTSQRSFTPGAHSVVSAEGGVGDQTSGWKGREYVIQIKAQLGPDVTERYGLSADGRQLVEMLHIGSGELPAVDLKRVYIPTNETAPRQLPSND
jgi:hypothetical protein